MDLKELAKQVDEGTVDTVVLAMTDMQGRLMGKRLDAHHFLDAVVEHGAEACNYLLAVDVDMTPAEGFAMSSWERGYGDFVLVPDLGTLRPATWLEGTVLLLADVQWEDGSDVVASPRQVLRKQLARLPGARLDRPGGDGARVPRLPRLLRAGLGPRATRT